MKKKIVSVIMAAVIAGAVIPMIGVTPNTELYGYVKESDLGTIYY